MRFWHLRMCLLQLGQLAYRKFPSLLDLLTDVVHTLLCNLCADTMSEELIRHISTYFRAQRKPSWLYLIVLFMIGTRLYLLEKCLLDSSLWLNFIFIYSRPLIFYTWTSSWPLTFGMSIASFPIDFFNSDWDLSCVPSIKNILPSIHLEFSS